MLKSLHRTHTSRTAAVLTGTGTVFAVLGFSLAAPAARAQNLPLFDQTTIKAGNIVPSKRAFDILRGLNKPGPYPLSWTNLRITRNDPVAVVNVDGKDLAADAYSFDAAKGTITFRQPLADSAYARVEYNYDPDLSKRNTEVTAAPVTLTQARFAGTSLQLMALPSVGDGKSSTDTAKLVWGLGGKTNLLGGGLTSQLLFGDAGNGKTGILDRSGMKLGYAMGDASNGVDVQFQRAGAGFAPTTGKAFGMGTANQNWSLGTRLKPTEWMSTNFKMADARDLTGNASSKENDLGLSLGGVRGSDPKFNFAKTDSLKVAADGKETRVSSDKMDLAQKLASSLSLNAKTETNKLDSPDQAKDLANKVTTYSLASQNAKGNVTQAALTLTEGQKETHNVQEKSKLLGVQLQPTGNVSFSLAQKGLVTTTGTADDKSENDREVAANDTTLSLVSKNAKGDITQAGVSLTQGTTASLDSSEKRQAIGVQLQPLGSLSLSLAQKGLTTTTGLADDKSENDREVAANDTTISLASKNAKGNITQAAVSLTQGTTESLDSSQKRQAVGVQLQPAGSLTLSLAQKGAVTTTGIADEDGENTREVATSDSTVSLASKNKKGNITQAAVSLTQGTTSTPETSEKRQSLTLQIQPSNNLTLSLAQNEKSVLAVVETAKVAEGDTISNVSQTVVGANLQLAPNTKLAGSVQQGVQDDSKVAVTNLSAQVGISKHADLSGGVINREASLGGVNDLDTKQVRLALRPSSTLSLSGGVVLNPQDAKGVISEAQRQDVSLTIKQGAWELGSGYAVTTLIGVAASDERGLALQTGEMSLNLGLRISPYSRLTGTYKNSFLYGSTNPEVVIGPRGSLVYGLNFTQNMGDAFSLSLGGTMTDNKAKPDAATQGLKAEAKLGLKF
jgi:hypothetical protein